LIVAESASWASSVSIWRRASAAACSRVKTLWPACVVTVELERDGATPSGFRWTSRKGPDLAFGSGTLMEAKITLEQRAPIELVVPGLRRWLGL
jgi:HlyD family secretion protein